MRTPAIGRILIGALAFPLLSAAAPLNMSVQAIVSGSIGSTTLNMQQVRLGFILDSALITGAVGSQSTPNFAGSATQVQVVLAGMGVPLGNYTLTGSARIVTNGGTVSFSQDGGGTITITNSALASGDLRGGIAVISSGTSAAMTFATSVGTLSIAAGARFSFHCGVDGTNPGPAPGPGGSSTTLTTTFKTIYNITSTTAAVETFFTRITGRLNGGTAVYDQTFPAAFSSPSVQAAVSQAHAAVTTAAGGGAVSITGPTRTNTSRTLTGSSQETVDGAGVFNIVGDRKSIGPAYLYVGDEEATLFYVQPGTVNLDLVTTNTIPRTVVTTNTYQTAETYSLDGTTQSTAPPTGLRFVSLAPCRLMETRAEYNFQGRILPFGPPFLNMGETRTFAPQLSTVCSVPASAKAYVLNVTLVPRGTVDFVTVYPAGEARPDFWTVRSPDGLIVANSAIVKAGAGGALSVFASNSTDMIIDIAGYFTDNAQESNLVYYPLTPCRVIETRQAYRPQTGPFGPPTLAAKQTRNFRFPQSPDCQIPSGAAAYSVTLTVVPLAALPFLTAWPAGASQPNVSSINSPNGRVLANSVIVPASSDGSISLYPFEATDAIVDIHGYFAPDNGTGLYYFPVTQCRVSNTTDASYTGNFGPPIFQDTTTRTIPIASSPRCSGSPATAKAYALNATVIPNGNSMPFLTVFATGQPQPNASVINAFEGQTVSSGFIVPAGTNGSVDVYAFRRTHVVVEISGYFGR